MSDVPYGIRASSLSSELDSCANDLLKVAAYTLVPGGRLVFLFPLKLADIFAFEDPTKFTRSKNGKVCLPVATTTKEPRKLKHEREWQVAKDSRLESLLDPANLARCLPSHPALELVHVTPQVLTSGNARLIVLMTKKLT